ncbi:shikimate dehydrogenase [Pseudooceanicola sp. 216_PA32_1]|uniref:Shikimate dehydrogenase (NADP(+)) n=1 Tax=Pseudooceanicola pacificus TaxID=2676438 RepID=A0A844WF70_9RHOB|nr:shikimate dehydrogenase [Pseudooceanicola pacificus]MWB78029.1 shikimate dehydrogenase [Pseudooceanicola pacificus]
MPDAYAVFGNPVAHSKSPWLHETFARQTGETLTYRAIEAQPGAFQDAIFGFMQEGGAGANVTAPFKLDACALADDCRDRAALAGAANCLKFEGGRIIADNFDGVGLTRDIEVNLGVPLAGKSVLLLGAGGAARGAIQPFLDAGPARLVVSNRTLEEASALGATEAWRGRIETCALADLGEESFDLVVNATAASLFGELPDIPPEVFGKDCLAYDLVYGKGLTPFLSFARLSRAAHIADGLGMLVEQAAEAFHWWRGVRPETGQIIKKMTVPLD